ncbi:Pentapeptide repeats (8 copies) [compost metagenome]
MTYSGQGWREQPASSEEMFDIFLIMKQLHEICWYLYEALSYDLPTSLMKEAQQLLSETEKVTGAPPHEVQAFNLFIHHSQVSALLREVSQHVRDHLSQQLSIHATKILNTKQKKDYLGTDLRKVELRCADLRGCLLIAANLEGADLSGADFLGSDLRDTNLRGADLSQSIFLTQSQINVAQGNSRTKLPVSLSRPAHWV